MDLHYLKLFNTLASELNYSKAASSLFISQPAVSMQIKKLENDLGLKLFDKIGKHLYLNSNGKLLFEYTKKIFSLVEEAEARIASVNGSIRGIVSIGASNTPGTYILPRVLGEFKDRYPQVDTNLLIGNTYEIEKMLFDNKVDFAINGGDISYSPNIYVEKLTDDEAVFTASPSSRLVHQGYVEPEELIGIKIITHEKNSQLYKLVKYIYSELGLPCNISMALGSIDAIKQAVSADLGISVIPRSAIKFELGHGILKEFKIKNRDWLYPYNLICHKNKYLSPAAEAMVKIIREKVKSV